MAARFNPRCRCLFATHHHGLCSEELLGKLAALGHMQVAQDEHGGILPSFKLAPGWTAHSSWVAWPCCCCECPPQQGVRFLSRSGPAPNGSCGIQVAAACGLPASVVSRAAEVSRQAEKDAKRAAAGAGELVPQRQALSQAGSTAQSGRAPLLGKRRRLLSDFGLLQQERRACGDGARGKAVLGAGDPRAALAEVQAAVQAVLAGSPGAARQLACLHAALRCSMAWED